MATRVEIERHYDTLGAMHALRMEDVQGEFPDYTCAFYNGDFSQTYTQAQAHKHAWIFNGLGLGQLLRGKYILDIGCGWGPMLHATVIRGGQAVGLTLSSGQYKYCCERGLDVRLRDYKTLQCNSMGFFDGIVSLGAFEHFCSVEDLLSGKQAEVYRNFFRICAKHLRPNGHLYLQTMTWGKQVPDYHSLSLDASPDSTAAILARILYLYPGSWLPNGLSQLIDCASDYFDLVSSNNGRIDYLQTLADWDSATGNLWRWRMLPRSLRHAIPLAFDIITNREARIQYQSIRHSDQNTCFAREIISHERIFFVKKRSS